ncbi:MAG TPA: TolC family outer membrane protein [Gammaproteobacteria bacterium]|nr:TolC family outer membrane protein [Gammaproteobacteria bacterium]
MRWLLFTAALLTVLPAYAADLLHVYDQAEQSDPVIKQAAANRQAALETKPQARAGLLPELGASANYTRNKQEITSSSSPIFQPNTFYYTSKGYSLNLTQPLYNRDSWVQLKQADSQIRQAEAQYAAAQQDLIIRVSQAYFNVLAARDNLDFAQAEKKAIARQRDQAQQRFEVGLSAITDVQEARARYDQAVTQEISAQDQLASAREALAEVTGQHYPHLAGVGPNLKLIKPDPTDPHKWVATARRQNLQLLATQAAADTAREQIERQRSGHYPTLDLVGSYGDSRISGGAFGQRNEKDSAIGVQLNVPIYMGGAVSSRTRQARSQFQAAQDKVVQVRRSTTRETRDAYRGVITGISQVKASEQAVKSSQTALKAAHAGFQVGTRTIVDVLDAQRELYRTRRDLSQSKYNYLLNTLKLKQAAGTLRRADVKAVNAWLKE